MSITTKITSVISEEQREQLFGWGDNIFGVEDAQYEWRPKDWHLLLYSDGRLVSHVGMLKHNVTVSKRAVLVGGIGGVVTVPEMQGKGLGQRAMRQATDFICQAWGVEFGLLLCLPRLEAFYRQLGWQQVPGPVIFDQPGGKASSPFVTMAYACRGRAWPQGETELNGLPW